MKLTPVAPRAAPDPDLAMKKAASAIKKIRRRYGKWAPLVQWAAEQKIARDNEINSKGRVT